MKKIFVCIASVFMIASTSAEAAKTANLSPLPEGSQQVRYEQGIPTIESPMVRVMPIREYDHGSIQFKVAVYNSGEAPFNFGVENINVTHNGSAVAVFTRDELEKKAKNRAMWSQIGYAMLAGAAAAAQSNTTTATTYGRYGTYHTVINRPGLSTGQLATLAAGGGAIALSQIGLQKTLESIGDETLQTTTVDPQSGYGGRVVIAKLKKAKPGDKVTLSIQAAGQTENFTFNIQK